MLLEPKHTRNILTSATLHVGLLCLQSINQLYWHESSRKVHGAPESQALKLFSFSFFTERLSLARIYPLQAKKVDTFIMLFFRLCLSHHLLSGFSVYRRILRRKAKYIGVSYFRLAKQMSNAHLNTANHFTFQKLNRFYTQYCSLWV